MYTSTTAVKERPAGFTIVELLIVIVVIAILATISIVAYAGIQNRANNAAVEADIQAIIKKLELAKIDLGRYPQSSGEFPQGFKFSKSAYDTASFNIYYCLDKTNDRYAFGLRSKSGRGYIINTGSVLYDVPTINAAETCDVIGKTWVNDATTSAVHGYAGSGWSSGWNWTN